MENRVETLDQVRRDATAVIDAGAELQRARKLHVPFTNAHEGHGVIMEEFLKLQAIVFIHADERNPVAMRKGAIQLAAMALKFASDLTPTPLHDVATNSYPEGAYGHGV